jgi:general secretion pathway protein I
MPRRRGFTLLEVLASLLIFSLTAVVLGGAYLNVLNSYEVAQRSNAYDGDVYYARSQLLAQADLTAAQTGAEFDDDTRHVKWTAEIDPASTTDLFTVTFTCVITDPSLGQPKTVVENFMLLRPTWSDPAARSELRQDAANRIALAQGKAPK